MKYFAPLSSPKAKYLYMKNQIDFLKIQKGELGAINFNNMLPVQEGCFEYIDLTKTFKTEAEGKYNHLLKEQLFWLNRHAEKVFRKSEHLYNLYTENKIPLYIRNRCCNFKLLENKARIYDAKKQLTMSV